MTRIIKVNKKGQNVLYIARRERRKSIPRGGEEEPNRGHKLIPARSGNVSPDLRSKKKALLMP